VSLVIRTRGQRASGDAQAFQDCTSAFAWGEVGQIEAERRLVVGQHDQASRDEARSPFPTCPGPLWAGDAKPLGSRRNGRHVADDAQAEMSQKGGECAYKDRLGKDRSPRQSHHSIASAK
jgi:hypothetical protein